MNYQPSWGSYISKENISWINNLLQKAKRYGFTVILHSSKDFMEQSDEKVFSRTICSNHCLYHLLHPDRSSLDMMSLQPREIVIGWVYTPLMNRGINVTWLQNLSFSEVYLITDDSSEHITCNDRFVTFACIWETVDVCLSLVVILMHLRNFASVEVFNKSLLTYLLAYLLTYLLTSTAAYQSGILSLRCAICCKVQNNYNYVNR